MEEKEQENSKDKEKDTLIKILVSGIVAGLTILVGFGSYFVMKTKNIINRPKN